MRQALAEPVSILSRRTQFARPDLFSLFFGRILPTPSLLSDFWVSFTDPTSNILLNSTDPISTRLLKFTDILPQTYLMASGQACRICRRRKVKVSE